jgi:hypothetical protein
MLLNVELGVVLGSSQSVTSHWILEEGIQSRCGIIEGTHQVFR